MHLDLAHVEGFFRVHVRCTTYWEVRNAVDVPHRPRPCPEMVLPVVIRKPGVTGEKIKTHSRKWWGQFRDGNGRLRRHPLCNDKSAAQAMLNDLVRKAEREVAGLVDPTEAQRKRSLKQHLDDFIRCRQAQGVTPKQLTTLRGQVDKIVAAGKWKVISDISVSVIGLNRFFRTLGERTNG